MKGVAVILSSLFSRVTAYAPCNTQAEFDNVMCKSYTCKECIGMDFCTEKCIEHQKEYPDCRCMDWPCSRRCYNDKACPDDASLPKCWEKATCDSFKECKDDLDTLANLGAGVFCSGPEKDGYTTCSRDECCGTKATCDTFDCAQSPDTPFNLGSMKHCIGIDKGSCDAKTCCEAKKEEVKEFKEEAKEEIAEEKAEDEAEAKAKAEAEAKAKEEAAAAEEAAGGDDLVEEAGGDGELEGGDDYDYGDGPGEWVDPWAGEHEWEGDDNYKKGDDSEGQLGFLRTKHPQSKHHGKGKKHRGKGHGKNFLIKFLRRHKIGKKLGLWHAKTAKSRTEV